MAIKNEENVYTEDFVALLKDYYLQPLTFLLHNL
jgi:hypothetical protein